MTLLHITTVANAESPGAAEPARAADLGARSVNDLWISDLANDLCCFGLCPMEEDHVGRPDELAFFSLTSDDATHGVLASRTHHDVVGL